MPVLNLAWAQEATYRLYLTLKAEQAVRETLERYDFRPTVIGEECGVIRGDSGYLHYGCY